jgi:catechol 2,3-dioxygenase-like lactoylglutathione lyase family enzyme
MLLLLFTCSVSSVAQRNEFGFSFNHQALSVTNLDSSVAFYKKVLMLEQITNRTEMAGISWFSLGEGKELHLVSVLKDQPVKINKAVHFAVTTSQFDGFIKHLEQNKIPYSNWPGKGNTVTIRADGIKQIYLQDPDGYWIEVNSVAVK